MKTIRPDLLIIGAGPAGLAAALEASKLGIEDLVVIERNNELGGILQQCIHDGFGLHRFNKQLSGPQYAQVFIDELEASNVEILLNTMVIDLQKDKTTYAINQTDGILEIIPKAVILAMGCRERTKNQVFIFGTRPNGIMTAGTLQRYMNIEGLIPGRRAVILGSGDIGLIMARRMKLEGIKVEGVYEIMDHPGGLQRNVFQCLHDYGIPLHLSTTVTSVAGKYNLEGVEVAQVDQDMNPIEETSRFIPCDLLVLSVGLIPENELSTMAEIPLSQVTKGPLVNNEMMTKIPGIFAAGNVSTVFDLVDYVSITGEIAARGALNYIRSSKDDFEIDKHIEVKQGRHVTSLLPTSYNMNNKNLHLFFRTSKVIKGAKVVISQGEGEIYRKRYQILRPEEMISVDLGENILSIIDSNNPIQIDILEN